MKRFYILMALSMSTPVFAVWDVTTPAGTEAKSLGDDRIREFKTDVQTALQYEGDFPGADTSNPQFIYTPSTGTTNGRPTGNGAVAGRLYINKSSGTIEQYNGVDWDVIGVSTFSAYGRVIPSGSSLVFFQASCPSGWTQVTSVGGSVLRSTNTIGGGSGGSTDVSTATFSHSHTVNAHTHDISHTHSTPAHTHDLEHTNSVAGNPSGSISSGQSSGSALQTDPLGGAGSVWLIKNRTETSGSGTTGAASTSTSGSTSPGTDTQGPAPIKYANIIICTAP